MYSAMMGKLGLSTDFVLQPYSYTYAGLLDGSVDISGAYANGGVLRLKNSGVELNVCWPDDYGVPFYGQALISTEDYIRKNPEKTRKLVKSFLSGLESTLSDPQAAVVATMKYAKEQDEGLQTAMIMASLPLIAPGNVALGSIDPKKFQRMNQILLNRNFSTALTFGRIPIMTVFSRSQIEGLCLFDSNSSFSLRSLASYRS